MAFRPVSADRLLPLESITVPSWCVVLLVLEHVDQVFRMLSMMPKEESVIIVLLPQPVGGNDKISSVITFFPQALLMRRLTGERPDFRKPPSYEFFFSS